ncbi:hypothetical protein EYR38_008333 [Pleurotus pulmonarius]|nr:hypothetical protein EYR38_008333 [Pleurotus pulmonarius]
MLMLSHGNRITEFALYLHAITLSLPRWPALARPARHGDWTAGMHRIQIQGTATVPRASVGVRRHLFTPTMRAALFVLASPSADKKKSRKGKKVAAAAAPEAAPDAAVADAPVDDASA